MFVLVLMKHPLHVVGTGKAALSDDDVVCLSLANIDALGYMGQRLPKSKCFNTGPMTSTRNPLDLYTTNQFGVMTYQVPMSSGASPTVRSI